LLASCLIAGGVGADPSRVAAASAPLPSRTAVLSTLNLVADYARRQYPANTEAYWDHGVYHIGMMALYDITRRSDALAYTTTFGDYNGWMLDRGGTANLHNRLAAGQSWIAARAATPRAAIDDTRTEVAAQTAASLAAVTSAAYFAVDAQFMALPAFAMLDKLDDNTSYGNRLHDLYTYNRTTLGLYDATARLYYRDASYIFPAKQTPNGKKLFWSRGNGWALATLARVLTELPLSDPARAEYVAALKQMSGALRTVQRADGFWNMSLYDANHYPGPETSGTALFVYGMAWGINNGLLSKSTYLPVVARAWNGMVRVAVHPDGKLGYVQGIGQAPVPTRQVTYESTADFGVGVFLLAGSEVARLTVDGERYETENLPTVVSAGDSQQDTGDAGASGGRYSRGVLDASTDYIQYSATLATPGTYNVKVRFGKAGDLGRWQFYTAGVNVGMPQDAFGSAFMFTEVSLGDVIYDTAGKKVFRFTTTGRNAASAGYGTAIDYVMLTKR